jgi:hypothetical protein
MLDADKVDALRLNKDKQGLAVPQVARAKADV